MRVGYLGPEGTFSHEAAATAQGADLVGLPNIPDVVAAVADGSVERALVPIENSLEGGVGATLDALVDTPEVTIVGEIVHPIRHCLIASAPVELDAVRTVVSHSQATAQCARFIHERLPSALVVSAPSTAEAVRRVVDGSAGEPPAVAIANRLAATLYGGQVLEQDIEDAAHNATRFAWIGQRGQRGLTPLSHDPTAQSQTGGQRGQTPLSWKTSVVWWGGGDEAPGWLVRCLSEFAFRGVSLTRIESRPRRLGLGHYMFFADLEGSAADAAVAEAIEGLRAQAEQVRVLGSYPAGNA